MMEPQLWAWLRYPFPTLVNPHAARIQEHTNREWIDGEWRRFVPAAVAEKFKKARTGYMTSYFFPMATWERLVPLARMMLFSLYQDDIYERARSEQVRRLGERIVAVARGEITADQAGVMLAPQIQTLRTELLRLIPGESVDRWAAGLEMYFDGLIEETSLLETGAYPALAEYMLIREKALMIHPFIALKEVETQVVLPARVHDHPTIQRLTSLAVRITGWFNESSNRRISLRDHSPPVLRNPAVNHRRRTRNQRPVPDRFSQGANMNATRMIPRAGGALPLLGHVVALLRDPLRFLTSLPAQGDLVRIRIGFLTAVVVCDQDLTCQVLIDDRTFDKGGPLFDRFREVAGNGVGSCPHSMHRRQRRLVQPAFHRTRLPGYAQTMTEEINTAAQSWRDGQVIDVLAEMSKLTARTTVRTMFTGTVSPATVDDVVHDVTVLIHGVYRRAFTPPPLDRLPTPGNRRYHRARARFRHTVATIIADYRATGIDHGDLLSILLITQDDPATAGGESQGLSDTEISDQVITFLFAGLESTAMALGWALHELARHPDIRQRLHNEIDTVLSGTTATVDDLPRLELTARIITETLRLHPPGSMFTRTVSADTRLGGYPIPAGTTLVYSPYLIHHRPDLHPNPEHFDPDRWTGTQPARDTFIPFGAGARKCIGDTFAAIEASLALATITAHWELTHIPGTRVRPAMSAVLQPQGLRMRVSARNGHRG
jgi:pentalenene oxygenase